MGIRGVDIQVAIQRAAEADKIQQGQTALTRAGEAVTREQTELQRVKNREQAEKAEKGGQLTVRPHKEHENQSSDKDDNSPEHEQTVDESDSPSITEDGHLDILV
jgi:hypothetical protein